jgi:hypothetical protein
MLRIVVNSTVNASGSFPEYAIVDRFFLGACYVNGDDSQIYLSNKPDECGPMIEDVVAYGRPFDQASYTAYLRGDTGARSALAPSLVPFLPPLLALVCLAM